MVSDPQDLGWPLQLGRANWLSACTLTTHPRAHAPDWSFGMESWAGACAWSTLQSYRQIVSSTTESEQASDKWQLSKVNASRSRSLGEGKLPPCPYARYSTGKTESILDSKAASEAISKHLIYSWVKIPLPKGNQYLQNHIHKQFASLSANLMGKIEMLC